MNDVKNNISDFVLCLSLQFIFSILGFILLNRMIAKRLFNLNAVILNGRTTIIYSLCTPPETYGKERLFKYVHKTDNSWSSKKVPMV